MSSIRVFVNAEALDVPAGATALECVRAWRESEADGVVSGQRVITDSRGLPVPDDAPTQAGSIFRTIARRGATTE